MKTIELPKCELTQKGDCSEYKVPNLDRGLSILEYLSNHAEGLTMSEISRALQIPRNSCHRILMSMMTRGFLHRHEKSKKFILTQKLLSIGSRAINEKNLIEEAIGTMRDLRDFTEETVLLNTRLNNHGVVLEQVTSRNQIRLVVDPGSHYELHCTAPGKVSLAFMSEVEQETLLKRLELKQYTPHTVTNIDALKKELDLIQQQGVAYDRSEGLNGVNCLSAPIFDRTGECIAALTVSGTSGTIPQSRFKELAPSVIKHASEISKRLGYCQ